MPEVTNPNTKLLENPVFHILILTVIAILAYSNTFQVPFLFDDEGSIQLNPAVHGLTNFFNGGYNFLPNRVIGYLTFAINYQLGELNVVGYHIVNLLIHIISALLVYSLVRVTFRTPKLDKLFSEQQINMFAFTVALLFVSHPVQTQAVTYIVQRVAALATMFYLAGIVCYARWRFTRVETDSFLKVFTSPWYVLSFIVAVLAMKTKEIAFTLPLIILLYECSFFGWPGRKLLAQMTPLLLTIAVIPYTLFVTVSPTLTAGGSMLSDVYSPAYGVMQMTRWDYLFTQFSVILTYLRLLIFPISQNLDYDYPISHSLLEPKTFISLMALLSIFMLAIYLFVKSNHDRKQRAINDKENGIITSQTLSLYLLASFGIFWFFITLSIESSIISLRDVIFEHRLYLPTFGFFLSAVSCSTLVVVKLSQRFKDIWKIITLLVAGTILTLSVATYTRNNVWQSWISIWSDATAKSPGKARAHNVLGIGYFYSLKFDDALREYREAVRLKPDFIEAYYNMGLVYKEKKQYEESLNMFFKVLSISAFNADQFALYYNEIGINYSELGGLDQAVKAFASAVENNPDSSEFRNNYAFALMTKGNREEALLEFQKVLKVNPGDNYAAEAIKEIESQKTGGKVKHPITPQRPAIKQ